ncbi:MAG: Tad domain-containing protein [Myxococcota bacterium]
MTRSPRGQNLVLLALTMLFLALMVTMTLGLGMRIRQKHELQNLADAAAYSNAVMEARAFNNAAVINRLQISYWVAQAADQSLISWTGYARGMQAGSRNALRKLISTCRTPRFLARGRQQASDLEADLKNYASATYPSRWDSLDQPAGLEAQDVQSRIVSLHTELARGWTAMNPDSVQQRLFRALEDQSLTQQIILSSRLTDIDVLASSGPTDPASVVSVNRREVDCDFGGTGNEPLEQSFQKANPGLCSRATWNENQLQAAMGTRGDSFVTGRGPVPPKALADIQRFDSNYDEVSISFSGVSGSAFWAPGANWHAEVITTLMSKADDHGTVTVSSSGCSVTEAIFDELKSTWEEDSNDAHEWTNAEDEPQDAALYHTMGSCTPACPSVWVRSFGFSPADGPDDAYGQPKVVVALERDLTKHVFPWELHFSFPFSATGPTRSWDGRGDKLAGTAFAGLNIRKQTAWSTGIIYYHRMDYWEEFPNLLNPFWRATLAPSDVDAQARDDVKRVLNQGDHRWQKDAFDELVRVGYKGLH